MYMWAGLSFLAAASWMVLGGERQTPDYVERFRSQQGNPLASIVKYKELWILGVGMAGGLAMESAYTIFWPTFAQQEMSVDPKIVGLGMGLYMFAAAPAELLVVSLRFLQNRQLTVMAVTGVVTMGTHMALLFTGSETLIVLINIFRGFSICYFPVIVTMVYQLPGIRPREVAIGLAFIYTVMNAGLSHRAPDRRRYRAGNWRSADGPLRHNAAPPVPSSVGLVPQTKDRPPLKRGIRGDVGEPEQLGPRA